MEEKMKQTSLETANEMYKDAFKIKMHTFAEKNPHLSEKELQAMTADYFRSLHGVNYDRSDRRP